MKPKLIFKLAVDMGMTAALLLLMAYELIGQKAHEWIGVGMFVLFVLHHILNSNWSRNLLKGKYAPFRVVQTILVVLVLAAMIGSMVSGVMLSRHVFSFLPIKGGRSFARRLHMISAYWGFVFMSLHLGFHWRMMMGMAGKLWKQPSALRKWIGRLAALFIAGYGVYAFVKRDIGSYMLLQTPFVFFDFEETFFLFSVGLYSGYGIVCVFGILFGRGLKKDWQGE